MSLSSHLDDKQSPVRQFIWEAFPTTRAILRAARAQLADVTTILPTGAVPWTLIGTAMDYRLRYYFEATPADATVAWQGAQRLGWDVFGDIPSPRSKAKGREDIGEAFFRSLDEAVARIAPVGRLLDAEDEATLNRYCIVLALLEQVFRSGLVAQSPLVTPTPKTEISALLAIAEEAWIDDLCRLSWAFDEQRHELSSRHMVLNPTFEGSRDVGGADADLITDGCLIEIKTTKNPRLDSLWLYQLLGYVLLDYGDRHRISSVGVYLTRQCMMLRWPLDELMGAMATGGMAPSLSELRAEFRRVASAG